MLFRNLCCLAGVLSISVSCSKTVSMNSGTTDPGANQQTTPQISPTPLKNTPFSTQLGLSNKKVQTDKVTVDSASNVIIVGSANGDFDGNYLTGAEDVLVTKFNNNGAKLWTVLRGMQDCNAHAKGVSTDSNNNIYVVATMMGGTTCGLDGNTQVGSTDTIVIKFDSNGKQVWTQQLGSTRTGNSTTQLKSDTVPGGIVVDTLNSNSVYVTGYTTGNLEGNTITGVADIFITKFDSSGNKAWTKQLGLANQTAVSNGIAVDSSGYVSIAGQIVTTLSPTTSYTTATPTVTVSPGFARPSLIGGGSTTQTGVTDIVLFRLDPSGVTQMVAELGTASSSTSSTTTSVVRYNSGANSIAVDSVGDIYLTGYTTGRLDGTSGPSAIGSTDVFLAKFSTAGVKKWVTQYGVASIRTPSTSFSTFGNHIAIDSSDTIFVTGSTTGGLNGETKTGSTDLFVIKSQSSGSLVWTQQLGAALTVGGSVTAANAGRDTYGLGIAVDSAKNFFVTGYTEGPLFEDAVIGVRDLFIAKNIE